MSVNEDIYSLIIDFLTDNLLPGERVRLQTWLNESERNKEEYRNICEVWYATRWVRYIAHISKNGAWNIIKLKREREMYRRRLYYMTAVAASVVMAFGIFTAMEMVRTEEIDPSRQVLAQSAPYSLQNINPTLILASGESIDLLKSVSGETLSDRGVAVRMDSTFLQYKAEGKFKTKRGGYHEVLVPRQKQMKLELTDGTVVYMNSVTRLRYPVQFGGDTREVYLDGEAYFDVAKDEEHPFVVHTNKTDVRVLGTEFNIMTYENEEKTEITLVNGAVTVKLPDTYTTIKPGEQISIDNKLLCARVSKVDVNKFIAWREGLYRFEEESLEHLLKYIERQYDISYFFENEKAKRLRFSGAFSSKSSVEEIFNILEQMTDVKFEMQHVKFEMQDGRKVLIR